MNTVTTEVAFDVVVQGIFIDPELHISERIAHIGSSFEAVEVWLLNNKRWGEPHSAWYWEVFEMERDSPMAYCAQNYRFYDPATATRITDTDPYFAKAGAGGF